MSETSGTCQAPGVKAPGVRPPVLCKAPGVRDLWHLSGPGAQAVAETWSAGNNGIMIGMTEFGQGIQGMTWAEQAAASEAFANSASGTVQVFSNDPLTNYVNIWYNIELPALAKNPDVTGMVFNPVPPEVP